MLHVPSLNGISRLESGARGGKVVPSTDRTLSSKVFVNIFYYEAAGHHYLTTKGELLGKGKRCAPGANGF